MLRMDTFEDYLTILRTLTKITGKTENYEQFGENAKSEIEQIISGEKRENNPKILFVRSGSSYSFGQAISSCFKRYATFDGRASKSEFWWFSLFCVLLGITYIGSLVTLLPSLAVAWRRMHDVGKPGAFCLIPIYGLILCFQDSQPGPNQYGSAPNPPA